VTVRGRVEHVTVTPLAFADPPLLNADGVHEPHVLRALIEVVVADGRGGTVSGFGESTGHSWQLDWLELVVPRLVGMSALDAVGLERTVCAALSGEGVDAAPDASWRKWSDRHPDSSRGVAPLPASDFDRRRVHAALEVAMLDATGRILDLPVSTLLGGARSGKVDYAGYLFYKLAGHPDAQGGTVVDQWGAALDPDAIVAQAERMIERYGFRSLKLKGGVFEPQLEVDTIRALGARFPDVPLRLDPNAAWRLETARARAAELHGLVEYLEDPVAGLEEMAEIRRATGVPLATNMCVTETAHIQPAMRLGSVDIVLGDHHYWGGMRGAVALAAAAEASGFRLSMHSNSHLGVSLAAMTHAGAVAGLQHAADTHYPWNAADDIVEPGSIGIEDGAVRVPDGPGLGIVIDRVAVDRLHRQYLAVGREHRMDQRYARRLKVTSVMGPMPRW
jgi:glucarate dehydratase